MRSYTTAEDYDTDEYDEQAMLVAPKRASSQAVRRYQSQQRTSRDTDYERRLPSSAINRQLAPLNKPAPHRLHWLTYVGIIMIVMLLGWIAFNAVAGWWVNESNNLTYGMPRTYQTDAVVGHSDSDANPSHFIAMNLHGHIEVIELPGGSAAKAKLYAVTTISSDTTPVTLSFEDMNGDGKPDMLVNIGSFTVIFLNTGTQFVPEHP